MAPVIVLTVASDRELCRLRNRGEELEEMPGSGRRHLRPIKAREPHPALVGPRLRQRPRHHLSRRRELGEPDIVEVPPSVVLLAHPAWRTTERADADSLAGTPRGSQTNHPKGHDPRISTVSCSVPGLK